MKNILFVSPAPELASDMVEAINFHASENRVDITGDVLLIGFSDNNVDDMDKLLSLLRQKKHDALIIQFPLPIPELRPEGKDWSISRLITPIIQDEVLNKSLLFILTPLSTYRAEAMALGVDDYIFLPFEFINLIERINTRFYRLQQLTSDVKLQKLGAKYIRHHVFISYSRRDTFFMKKFVQDLKDGGVNAWTDESLEVGTQAWAKEIQDAIEHSGAFIVLMSPDAKASLWVNREINYALEHNVRIFPVLIESDMKKSIPIQLIDAQISNLTENYTPNLAKLIKTIKKHVGIIDFRE